MLKIVPFFFIAVLLTACTENKETAPAKKQILQVKQGEKPVKPIPSTTADEVSKQRIEQPKLVKFVPPVVVPRDPDPMPLPDPYAYREPFAEPVEPPASYTKKQEDEIHDIVEVMPEFPGGQPALLEYLKNNIRYPEEAKETGLMGKVFVGFVVRKDGSITDVTIKRGVHASLDKEAVRVIKAMPKWKPGMNNGKAVHCRMIVPIKFSLD